MPATALLITSSSVPAKKPSSVNKVSQAAQKLRERLATSRGGAGLKDYKATAGKTTTPKTSITQVSPPKSSKPKETTIQSLGTSTPPKAQAPKTKAPKPGSAAASLAANRKEIARRQSA